MSANLRRSRTAIPAIGDGVSNEPMVLDAKERRKKLLAALLTAAALLAGCSGGGTTHRDTGVLERTHNRGRPVYFSFADPIDDDKGPGRYQYPLSFENREGFLDVTRFSVEDGGRNVIFQITCRRPISRWRDDGSTESKGFWMQLADIYIDKDHKAGSGYTKALPGRHVSFAPESAWEKVILVTPAHSRTVERMLEERTSDLELVNMRKKIIIPHQVTAAGFTFQVVVPKYEIGEPQPEWGYQVLMMGFNQTNLATGQFQNQEVVKFAQENHYGGGSDYRGDPNVMDLLAPTARDQYQILGNYTSRPFAGDDRLAQVPCIYGSAVAAAAPVAKSMKTVVSPVVAARQVVRPPAGHATTYGRHGASIPAKPVSQVKPPVADAAIPKVDYETYSFEGGF